MTVKKHSEIEWGKLVRLGKQLVGKPYRFGAETDLRESDPAKIAAIDCSELVEWLYAQLGLTIPDGSYNQAKVCARVVGDPLVGDLGFKAHPENNVIHHVGVCLGDGTVLEAKGKAWGVVVTPLANYTAPGHDFSFWGRLKSIAEG